MHTKLYIPKKIQVGFQKRRDTFTGMLGFVTYVDDKGLLRQEKSWNQWRDNSIAVQEFDNIPCNNFVFNKDVTRSGHWNTTSKVRIHDSRGFEFEIHLSNMMYILMHSDVSKRDIQEECIFGWDGKDLVLVPVNSEDYQKSVEHTKKQSLKFSLKDLVQGHTYSTKSGGSYIYIGYYEWCEQVYFSIANGRHWVNTGKRHIFARSSLKSNYAFIPANAQEIAECINDSVHPEYSHMVEELFKSSHVQKIGSFSVKKGFENSSDSIDLYKQGTYQNLMVSVTNNPQPNFTVERVDFCTDNDKPKVVRARNRTEYYDYVRWEREYKESIKDKGINPNNIQELQEFFKSIGYGLLYYTNTEGKKEVVTA